MEVGERDPHTGHMTTGHEWNGITELNTPVPRWIWLFLIATVIFSVGYWILMPAWPLMNSHTRGLLGHDDRQIVTDRVARAEQDRTVWGQRIVALDYDDIRADPALMTVVREHGQRLFGDNCAVCHGTDAAGVRGFPSLINDDWLWGGDPDTITETIRVGVNSNLHSETRVSEMMAFGASGILDNAAVQASAHYVKALSDPAWARGREEIVARGRAVFADNCVICHGDDARGNQTLGSPDLTSTSSIYGNDIGSIYAVIHEGRQGEMPAWEQRLSPAEIKLLALYLLDKGGQ